MQAIKEQTPIKSSKSLKTKICERLKRARVEAGYSTAKDFAMTNNLKISTYALHEAGTRSMSFEVIESYSDLLNINANWLLTNEGPKSKLQFRSAPIIEWEEVAAFPKKIDFDNKQWTTSDIDLSPFSFALIVTNDAMEPRYPEGTVIIVDCHQKPNNKDFALLNIKGNNQPLFKQIVQIDNEWYAKSLNIDYKTLCLPKNFKIIGKVVQAKLIC